MAPCATGILPVAHGTFAFLGVSVAFRSAKVALLSRSERRLLRHVNGYDERKRSQMKSVQSQIQEPRVRVAGSWSLSI